LQDQPHLIDRRARRRASSDDIRAIILSPTRELAEQIGVEAKRLAQNTGIVVQTAVGGTRKRESLMQMHRQGCDVLVATPGRLHDLLSDSNAGVAAPKLQAFVLDEADRMLDVGFSDAIKDIMEYLPSRTEVERQTLLFSATIPRNVIHLAKSMVRPDNFEFVQTIKPDEVATHERVPQHLVKVEGLENVFPAIMEIAERAQKESPEMPFKAIVFFSNTASVQFASEVFRDTTMRRSGVHIYEIHSRRNQGQRTRAADSFRRARSAILFSSDVTARGMDFPNVTDVIQVGLPPDRDQYIHRVGRTGRAGNSGNGWLLLTEEEIPEARARLPGLPIKPTTVIESARYKEGSEESPSSPAASYFKEIKSAYASLPKDLFNAVYLAYLGQKFGRNFQAADAINILNKWALEGMGWTETPHVPQRIAQLRGLAGIPGLRTGNSREHDDSEGFSSRPGFSRGDSFGRGNRFDDRFDDRFESRRPAARGFQDRFGPGRGGFRNGGSSDRDFRGGRSRDGRSGYSNSSF
jgi:ATP-dependent RNA helicase MSS116, mitochondrial